MKAHVQLIGDYDEQTETLGIQLIAYEKDVIAAGIEDGKEVEVVLVSNKTSTTEKEHDAPPDSDRQYQLRETLRLWDVFIKDAPLAEQIHTQCRILMHLWRAELESIEAVSKCHALRNGESS